MSLSEADIDRAAKILVDLYGEDASREAGKRADRRRAAGDHEDEIAWLTVLMTLKETERRRRKEGRARAPRNRVAIAIRSFQPQPTVYYLPAK